MPILKQIIELKNNLETSLEQVAFNMKYRVFYIKKGKFFISKIENGKTRQAITKNNPTFKRDCLWFTFDECIKFIKENRSMLEVWGVVDENGKQSVVGKFDGILQTKLVKNCSVKTIKVEVGNMIYEVSPSEIEKI